MANIERVRKKRPYSVLSFSFSSFLSLWWQSLFRRRQGTGGEKRPRLELISFKRAANESRIELELDPLTRIRSRPLLFLCFNSLSSLLSLSRSLLVCVQVSPSVKFLLLVQLPGGFGETDLRLYWINRHPDSINGKTDVQLTCRTCHADHQRQPLQPLNKPSGQILFPQRE